MVMQEFHALVNEAKKEIQEITPADLKKMQQSGDDFVLVDVREKDEAAKGMIPNAANITRGTLELSSRGGTGSVFTTCTIVSKTDSARKGGTREPDAPANATRSR